MLTECRPAGPPRFNMHSREIADAVRLTTPASVWSELLREAITGRPGFVGFHQSRLIGDYFIESPIIMGDS